MSFDLIPLWAFFAGTVIIVMASVHVGHRLGRAALRHFKDEKESPVSAISGFILGLLAFMLAFTFSIVSDRYDNKRALVREEANIIGAVYLRSDFMSEPDRGETKKLLREYVDSRLSTGQSPDNDKFQKTMIESHRIQHQLWNMAVVNARKDMNSDVAALYIESLNEMVNVHAQRVAVGGQARIPVGIWLGLYLLAILGMVSIGYQTAIAQSKKSWVILVLALSFAVVISLIASLNNPWSRIISVSQQPLVNLKALIAADL